MSDVFDFRFPFLFKRDEIGSFDIRHVDELDRAGFVEGNSNAEILHDLAGIQMDDQIVAAQTANQKLLVYQREVHFGAGLQIDGNLNGETTETDGK